MFQGRARAFFTVVIKITGLIRMWWKLKNKMNTDFTILYLSFLFYALLGVYIISNSNLIRSKKDDGFLILGVSQLFLLITYRYEIYNLILMVILLVTFSRILIIFYRIKNEDRFYLKILSIWFSVIFIVLLVFYTEYT